MTGRIDAYRARRFMMTCFEARLDMATTDEIGRTRSALERLAQQLSSDGEGGVPALMIRAIEQLLFVEQQLRDDEVELEIRRILARRNPDEPG